jgi:hypothetical protein
MGKLYSSELIADNLKLSYLYSRERNDYAKGDTDHYRLSKLEYSYNCYLNQYIK